MKKFLKSIDMHGKEFVFNIGGESTYRTIMGGILSLFTYIAFILLTWYYGQDIYNKQDPTLLVHTEYLNDYPIGISNRTNNFMALGMKVHDIKLNTYLSMFDERIVIPRMYFTDISFVDGGSVINNSTSVVMKNCSLFEYDENIYNINNSFCYNYNDTFGGGEDSTYFKVISQSFSKCNNDSSKVTCLSDSEINATYNRFVLTLTYEKKYVDPKNYTNPIQTSYAGEYIPIDFFYLVNSNYNQVANIYYQISEVITDSGVFFEDLKNETFYEIIDFQSLLETKKLVFGKDTIVSIRARLSKKIVRYERKYIKIPDLLANVGGLMSLVTPIIEYVFSFYLDNKFILYLYKKMFKLELEEDNIENIEKNNFKEIERLEAIPKKFANNNNNKDFENISNDNSLESNSDSKVNNLSYLQPTNIKKDSGLSYNKHLIKNKEKDIVLNRDIHEMIEHKSKLRKEVVIEYCERSMFIYCCGESKYLENGNNERSPKDELIKAAEAYISKKSEIFEVFRTIDQLRLLSKIILNANQCFMIQNRSLQSIIHRNKSSSTFSTIVEEKFESNLARLTEYLRNKDKNNEFNPIDIMLFKYLDKDIKSNIQKEVNLVNLS